MAKSFLAVITKALLFLFPLSISVDEITNSFRRYGHLVVDWPHKAESKSYFPPKGKCHFLGFKPHLLYIFPLIQQNIAQQQKPLSVAIDVSPLLFFCLRGLTGLILPRIHGSRRASMEVPVYLSNPLRLSHRKTWKEHAYIHTHTHTHSYSTKGSRVLSEQKKCLFDYLGSVKAFSS